MRAPPLPAHSCYFRRLWLLTMMIASCGAFAPRSTIATSSTLTTTSSTTTILQMCICIDCSRVTNCRAYHFVETKHHQPHLTADPTFTPREGSPTIHVNVRQASLQSPPNHDNENENDNGDDDSRGTSVWDRIRDEHQAEEEQAITAAAAQQNEQEQGTNHNGNGPHHSTTTTPPSSLHGKTVYDISSATTIEYDVVACEDYAHDPGCW
mmetsp:Transcript_6253/g.13920  ORF Transcript_6253/g.13920 Transcript_6253/m.13920 type:complete len:209 (-) Transcript_6253:370-996(-)